MSQQRTVNDTPVKDASNEASESLAELRQHVPNRVPNSYIVVFKAGHTVEAHFTSVGKRFPLDERPGRNGWMYYANNIDNDLLERIRSDYGVQYVEENQYLRLERIRSHRIDEHGNPKDDGPAESGQ